MNERTVKPKPNYQLIEWRNDILIVNLSQYKKRSKDGFLVDAYHARVLGWVVSSSEILEGESLPRSAAYKPLLKKDEKGCRTFLRGKLNSLESISFEHAS